MIRFIAIVVIVIFLYYAVKFIGRIFLRSFARKVSTPPPFNAQPKPKSNLDKSKAIDAQFEELK
jgi:Na+-transporting methylmalonyl-CoA/oxaloacetate decarboxylase gamma subunit